MLYSNPHNTGSVNPSVTPCVDCGRPALDRFERADDVSQYEWLCQPCLKARWWTLVARRHYEAQA